MKTFTALTLAGVFAAGLATTAQAQSSQIPNPAHTNPANPIATDGSPLPLNNAAEGQRLFTGRSAFVDPVGGIVGIAGHTVDTGLNAARSVVSTGVDASGNVLR